VSVGVLRPLRRHRIVDDVVRSLEDAILAGRMRPGERLLGAQLAEQLGVSQTTVREALLMLENRGLVKSEPRRGSFVTRLAREDARDLCRARALIEGYAIYVGLPQIDAECVRRLEAHVGAMRDCRLPDDVPNLIRIDLAFHEILARSADSERLIELWSSLNGQIGALFLTGMEHRHADIEDIARFHHQLVEAVGSGDPCVAQAAVVEHYVQGNPDSALTDAAILETTRLLDIGND
jgi:DNA-binding GntR family transcriptional regulator